MNDFHHVFTSLSSHKWVLQKILNHTHASANLYWICISYIILTYSVYRFRRVPPSACSTRRSRPISALKAQSEDTSLMTVNYMQWWRVDLEMLCTLLAPCEGNSSVTGRSPRHHPTLNCINGIIHVKIKLNANWSTNEFNTLSIFFIWAQRYIPLWSLPCWFMCKFA